MITIRTIVNPDFEGCVPIPCKYGKAFYIEKNKDKAPKLDNFSSGSVASEDPFKDFEDEMDFTFRAYSGLYD